METGSPDPFECHGMGIGSHPSKCHGTSKGIETGSPGPHATHEGVDKITVGGEQSKPPRRRPSTKLVVEKLGAPIHTIGGLRIPKGVAVNQKREVVVTEWDGHCVTVFSPSGGRLRSFGTHGSYPGQFDHPSGVAVDSEGNILVADHDNHRIQKFTVQGEFLSAVGGTRGTGPLQFNFLVGIAFSTSNGRVYVVENDNVRVQILNSDLSYHGTFGKSGSGKGQFYSPQHVACDSAGNVYVAGFCKNCIQVFTAEGEFLRMFRRGGEGRGDLERPWGVAIDSSDRVYVSEHGNHCVSIFTSEGQFVTSVGSEGEEQGHFSKPTGLAVDNTSDVVYVCDNDSLQVILSNVYVHNLCV